MVLKRATYKKVDLTLLDDFHNQQLNKIELPEFRSGDEIEVKLKVTDSSKEKIDTFSGICLGRYKKNKFDASFLIRSIVQGQSIERKICVNNPNLLNVKVLEYYKNKQSKPYYIRERFGKQLRFKIDVKRKLKLLKIKKK